METISIYAPGNIDPYSSYGLLACELLRHIDAQGIFVNALATGDRYVKTQPGDIARLTQRPIMPSFGGIVLGYPTWYERHSVLLSQRPKVALTMFESSLIPDAWVDILNGMDAVIVPSTFCYKSFADSGVNRELLRIVPLGISSTYQYVERETERPLTFLAFVDRGARKGGNAAIQAFVKAFGDRTDVRLILKGRGDGVKYGFTNDNIDLIQRDMSEDELYELYQQCDVLINPNKGEGFGLIPREFAATGGIALTTNWSGTADMIEAWGYPLPYTLEVADWTGSQHEGQPLGVWASPDIDGIAAELLNVADNIELLRLDAKYKADCTRELYNWESFAFGVLSVWESVKQ